MSNVRSDCVQAGVCWAVNSVTTACEATDFVLGAESVNNWCGAHPRSVATYMDLISLDNVSTGTIMFVEDIRTPVIYNNCRWLGLDGRVFIDGCDRFAVWTWGNNGAGQLGNLSVVARCSPGTIAGGGSNWCRISSGAAHSIALKTDGSLWSWGCNGTGQLGNLTAINTSSPVTASGGGTIWCTLSAGVNHTGGVKTDGTLWMWGQNVCGILGSNTVVNSSSPGTTSGGGNTWCVVTTSQLRSAAIKSDGTMWIWGYNTQGRLGDGTVINRSSPVTTTGGGTTWCTVSAGVFHTAAVKTDGTVWTWGYNNCGRLGDGTVIARSSPGTTAGGGTNWCAVAASSNHTAALKTDGTVWTWGYGRQLGAGTLVDRSSPGTTSGGGTTWCAVSVAKNHTSALKTDGTAWTWGYNSLGQLGDGTVVARLAPGTTSGGGTNWCAVAAGNYHTAAIGQIRTTTI